MVFIFAFVLHPHGSPATYVSFPRYSLGICGVAGVRRHAIPVQ